MVFFKKLRPLFLYLTYELVQIFKLLSERIYLCLNQLASRVSMGKELSYFLYTLYKARGVSRVIISRLS